MKFIFSVIMIGFCQFANGQRLPILKKFRTNVPEPSDMIYNHDYTSFFMVSDQGYLFLTDTSGKILKQAKQTGTDFEGLYADDKYVYVTDERTRRIMQYDASTLSFIRQFEVGYNGAANEGYEGMTFNKARNCYVLAVEKNPTYLIELNLDFQKMNEVRLHSIADISSLTFHDNAMYLLSDEDEAIYKLDPNTYAILASWKIPVTNPEGICFDQKGNLVIQSDKDQMIYKFSLNQLPK